MPEKCRGGKGIPGWGEWKGEQFQAGGGISSQILKAGSDFNKQR